MKKRISELSVSKKTLLWLTVFVMFPLMVIGGVVFTSVNRQQEKTERDLIMQRLDYVVQNITGQLDTMSDIADDLSINENVYDVALNSTESKRHYASWQLLNTTLKYNTNIVKTQILSDGKVIWQYGARTGYAFDENGNEEYAAPIESGTRASMWSPAHVLKKLNNGKFTDSMYLVSYYRGIYDVKSMKPKGVLALHTEEESIRRLYENFLYGDMVEAWVVLEDGQVLSATRDKWLKDGIPQELSLPENRAKAGNRKTTYDGAAVRLFWQKCDSCNGYLVQMNRETNAAQGYFKLAILMILFFGFMYAGYAFFYRIYVIHPLELLTRQMEKAKNLELKQEILPVEGDEIGLLTTTFQSMLHHIDNLIEKVYVEKIKTQEAEREAMLSQINPHFLYNTLDSIRWNALSHGEKEVAGQLEALSVMLRNTLNFGKMDTTIKEEMQIIKNYCFLLQARFRNEIEVEIDVNPLVLDYRIPKLLIQPLVENAYKHGLENKIGQKKIWIKIRKFHEKLMIYVADNGVGCRQELIEEMMLGDDSRKCFALKNIRDRIQLSYGDRGSFHFSSWEGIGTIAKIVLPLSLDNRE